jgi:hypothetical protein
MHLLCAAECIASSCVLVTKYIGVAFTQLHCELSHSCSDDSNLQTPDFRWLEGLGMNVQSSHLLQHAKYYTALNHAGYRLSV